MLETLRQVPFFLNRHQEAPPLSEVNNSVLKALVAKMSEGGLGASGFEPPTSWSRTST
jgi:hypothetical protein